MSDRAPYSRVYWSIVDDPKFLEIYDDDRRLATWLRLLLIADQAHPASPHVPAGTNRGALKALVDCGLISFGTGNRYRICGLDKERARRQTGPKRVPDGTQMGPKPPLARAIDETRQDETRQRAIAGPQERPASALDPRRLRGMHQRRLELYRMTGVWPEEEWGPKPTDLAVVR